MNKYSCAWSVLGVLSLSALCGCDRDDQWASSRPQVGAAGATGQGSAGQGPILGPGPTSPPETPTGQPALFQGATKQASGKVAPVAAGTLLVTKDGYAVAADPDRDAVHVVQLRTQKVVSVLVNEGDEPGRVVEGPSGTAYVVARRGGAVLAVDLAAGTAQRFPVCTAPRGVAYDAPSSKLYVACRSGVLAEMDAKTGEVTARHRLDPDLRDVVLSGDHLVVTRFKSAEALVVSRAGEVLRRSAPPAGTGATTPPFTPSVAFRTLALPGGGVLVGHVESSNTTLPSGAGAYYGGFCGGSVADLAVSVLPDSAENDNVGPNPINTLGGNRIGGASGPLDLALSPDGQRVAMLAIGNSWSGPVPVKGNLWLASVADIRNGAFAAACVGTPNAVTAEMVGGEPVAVAFDADGRWVVQSREPAQLSLQNGGTISLASDSRFDTGFAMFHMNTGGGIACTSCHPEAGEDGHTWNFSVGPRRSQTLEGGASARAPFHWSGDLHSFDELVDEVMLRRMSLNAYVSPEQRAALSTWLDSVPRAPTADDLDAAAVERGRALFNDEVVGCATCHAGADFSDRLPHDVGTGGSFITPSLVDVNMRAPLFHDGCAVSLAGRFGPCGGGDKHGITSKLSRADEADLVAYMQSL